MRSIKFTLPQQVGCCTHQYPRCRDCSTATEWKTLLTSLIGGKLVIALPSTKCAYVYLVYSVNSELLTDSAVQLDLHCITDNKHLSLSLRPYHVSETYTCSYKY